MTNSLTIIRPGGRCQRGRRPSTDGRTVAGARSTSKICQDEGKHLGQTAYSQSKLASVMFSYGLARRLEGHRRNGHRAAYRRGEHPFMKTAHQGAATSDPPRVLADGGGRHRDLFRERQTPDLEQGLVRRRRGDPPVAGQCRPRRPRGIGVTMRQQRPRHDARLGETRLEVWLRRSTLEVRSD